MDTIPNEYDAEWTQSQVETIPEQAQSQMDKIVNEHDPE